MKRLLILEDGSYYEGKAFGGNEYKVGELVFNTSMTGYQEIITDNSYCGQIVMMTYPLIGNYGINRDDNESLDPAIFGFVVKDYCEKPSNFRTQETLGDYLKKYGIAGIYGIDTRAITRRIRTSGTMRATLADADADISKTVQRLKNTEYLTDQVQRVSTSKVFQMPNRGNKVVLMDFGAKMSIVRELSNRGCELVIVPYNTSFEEIMGYHPDGVILSNGPGNPEDIPEAIETIKKLIPKTKVFGICLGHQLISLACGAKTYKLKFGHRGNYSVVNQKTNRVDITSQNHGFAVDIESLKGTDLEMTHKSLHDGVCQGVRHTKYPTFSVQFHPEASAGPEDTKYLFDEFVESMKKGGLHG